ncbi:threonine ammonia-lyase IlvA [Flavobacteriaceae bacterium]|nr:threonine ammonia-lyase IlvA [Flavobacteriaceae bacterium]MDB3997842.1 threonine ammonia-lyase IlvA [Flavobacteriaceae bacterium]
MKLQHPSLEGVQHAKLQLKEVCKETVLESNKRLSEMTGAFVFLKREDLQQVRSFKIRGAYNKIASLTPQERERGIVCASAGNHAQGFAFACNHLKIRGRVYMPATAPQQKIAQVKMFGEGFVETILTGDTYDACQKVALETAKKEGQTFIHAFDDVQVIEGQATIALEMIAQHTEGFDYVFVPVGGGGLVSGILTVFKALSPKTKIIGVEPEGAQSMKFALELNKRIPLKEMDRFVDGAAVRQVGALPFEICKEFLDDLVHVPEGKICQAILDLYNKEGIVAEPAGALAIAALDLVEYDLKNKNIGVLLCGGNNDILRMPEIKERALLYANLKHYFIIDFPQRAGALKQFVNEVLGPEDDITHFEFSKKSSKSVAPAVVGIELKSKDDLGFLVDRMKNHNFNFDYLNEKENLFQFLK